MCNSWIGYTIRFIAKIVICKEDNSMEFVLKCIIFGVCFGVAYAVGLKIANYFLNKKKK